MKVVMIVPTGIGCSIGGHAGDANPAARLLSTVCDELILHPNVVNGSDINEMRENCLYVDGYALDQFLEGHIVLRRVRSNKILVVTNRSTPIETINAVGAARATLGVEAVIRTLDTKLFMEAWIDLTTGAARGMHKGVDELIDQVGEHEFDALAISTEIKVDWEVAKRYLKEGGVNPWGKIEADTCREISAALGVPVAHAPIEGAIKTWNEVVDDRRAAECVSVAYLHCVLKGLHRAPKLVREARPTDLHVDDIDMLVSPTNCWGRPHKACKVRGIEVVWVRDNCPLIGKSGQPTIEVASYLEAAGLIAARRVGVSVVSVTRRTNE